MRRVYCCNSASYEEYYLDQVGHGQYFSRAVFQRGYGLDHIFASLGKVILPLVKSGAKANEKQARKSGVAFTSKVLAGKNIKRAALQRTKQVDSTLLRKATASKKRKTLEYKRRNVKYNDIFT